MALYRIFLGNQATAGGGVPVSVSTTGVVATVAVGTVTVTTTTSVSVNVTGQSIAVSLPLSTTVRTTFGSTLGQYFLGQLGSTTNPFPSSSGHVTVAVGDLVYAVFTEQTSLTATAANDILGNTYTVCNSGSDVGAVAGRAFYSIITIPGTISGGGLTISCSASSDDAVLIGQAFQGPFVGIDANPANASSDITSPYNGPATGTLVQADELLVAWANRPDSVNFSSTSPLIQIAQAGSGNVHAVLSYQVLASTSTVTPQWTSVSDPSQLLSGTTTFRAQGSVSVNVTTNLVTASVGTVTVTANQTVSVNVTGNPATASVGTVTVSATGAGTSGAWDVNDKTTNITLSNSDKTATAISAASNEFVQSTDGHSSGLYYAEILIDVISVYVGIGALTDNYTTSGFTGTAGFVHLSNGDVVDHSASTVGNIGTFTAGDTICVAVNATSGKIWFRKNSGNWDNNAAHDPATGTGGFSYTAGPSLELSAILPANTCAVTINTGGSAFSYSAPSGFSNWYVVVTNVSVNVTGQSVTASVGNEAIIIGGIAGAWNTNDHTNDIVLSGSDLIATGGASADNNDFVRSTDFHASGKYFVEITVNNITNYNAVGIVSGDFVTFTGSGGSYWLKNGVVLDAYLGYMGAGAAAFSAGNVLDIAIDATAGLIWYRNGGGNWNNSGTANPATGVGGITVTVGPNLYVVAILGASSSDTINTGTSAFTYPVPSGFTNWYVDPSASVSVTGQSVTASVGTVTVNTGVSINVTSPALVVVNYGNETVNLGYSVFATGNQAAVSVGNETVNLGYSVFVTTNLITASVGGVSVTAGGNTSTTVSGNQVGASVGTVTVNAVQNVSTTLTTNLATVSGGNESVTTGTGVSTTLTTNLMTASVGNETVNTAIGINQNVTGQSVTASVGTVFAGGLETATVEVFGQEIVAISFFNAIVSISVNVAVTGQSMTASVGNEIISLPKDVAVTGQSMTVSTKHITLILNHFITVHAPVITVSLGQVVSPNWGSLGPGEPIENWTNVSGGSGSWTPVPGSSSTPNDWT